MKSTLIASIPAFVVLFGLAFGFVTFHVIVQKAEATGAECNYLEYNCDQEIRNAKIACNSNNAERCQNAKIDRLAVCNEYYETCR